MSGYGFFAGDLDEIRVSSSVRYTGTFTPPSVPFSSDADTLALYHMDAASGQTVADASGNNRTLTLGASSASASDDPTWITPGAVSGGSGAAPGGGKVRLRPLPQPPEAPLADTTSISRTLTYTYDETAEKVSDLWYDLLSSGGAYATHELSINGDRTGSTHF